MEWPRKWVNKASLQDTEAAAKLTGFSDEAFEVIPYDKYLEFKAELDELIDIRTRFSSAKQKYLAEEMKTREFGLELRRARDIVTNYKKKIDRQHIYIIGLVISNLLFLWLKYGK